MTKVVKGAGRAKHHAAKRHAQRTPLPERGDTSRKKAREAVKEAVKESMSKAAPMSRAAKVALAAEEAGWTVKRIMKDNKKTVKATRGDETFEASWVDDKACAPLGYHRLHGSETRFNHVTVAIKILEVDPEVAVQSAAHAALRKNKPRKGTATKASVAPSVPFNPKVAENEEVMRLLLGHRIIWINAISGLEEEAIIPVNGKQTRIDEDDLNDLSTRQLTFCDADGGGFTTVRLSDIVGVSPNEVDDGHMLVNAQHRALLAMQQSRKNAG